MVGGGWSGMRVWVAIGHVDRGFGLDCRVDGYRHFGLRNGRRRIERRAHDERHLSGAGIPSGNSVHLCVAPMSDHEVYVSLTMLSS